MLSTTERPCADGNGMHPKTLRLSLFVIPALLAACASTPEHTRATPEPSMATATPLREAPAVQDTKLAASQPFREDAPRNYTVKPGDTLWGLAQRFLKNPWSWPEIWYANPRVRNPHLIFPGDQLVIASIDGKARLTKKLTPHVRISPLDKALPTLPLVVIGPFLNYPQVIEVAELNQAPQVIGSPDGRLVLGTGDLFHTHGGMMRPNATMAVVRPHKTLVDPVSGDVLGFEVEAAGKAVVQRNDEPATLRLVESRRETRKADRLIGLPNELTHDLALKAAQPGMAGRVVSLPDESTRSAQWQIIALNKGRADGMEQGHVVRLHAAGEIAKVDTTAIPDTKTPKGGEADGASTFDNPVINVRLPDVALGDAVVFLVYDRVSYALITEVTRPVRVGDCFSAPTESCR